MRGGGEATPEDYCPENSAGFTNWFTFDPDNNGDDVLS